MSSTNIFLISIVVGLFISFSFYSQNLILGSDFVNIYTAVSMIKNGQGKNLYDLDWQETYQKNIVRYTQIRSLPFRHSPLIAWLLSPLSNLSFKKAYLLFAYLNILGLVLFYLAAKKIFVHISSNLLFVVLIFLSAPALRTLLTGQTPILLSFILLALFSYLKRQDWFMAGVVGGLIFFLKIQLILLLPFFYLISKNRKKFMAGFGLSLIVLLFISLQVVGLPGLLSYPGFIFKTENGAYGSNLWDSFSLASLLSWLGINGGGLLIANILLYILAFLFFAADLKKRSFEQNFTLSSILAPLFAVHFLAHDLTVLNVTILILFDKYYQLGKNNKRVIFFVAVLLYSLIFFLIVPVIFGLNFNLGPFVLLFTVFILNRRKLWN
ncbi:hypothetical protein A2954_00820 [Candidatus Roizmanbacteria bacterium RIFCSPLOWO2_01_FULL_37_12]|uniref:Glycosyltransferase RgtA/B/C/D-like domain-containing protein n=1 Tax=Candidatus Roizmanbacteria bacterium RIFCSPLOWO2_01_FULL_37_12 TaxID=1802056 RepID=A0A1F7IDV1_9BACT|nr:MAG: hypothetical protein A3D76_01015 [Candidatus Roizmanbacteria bacterium RIFCSPHIGHO2_02_FULL_37_9b]OGK41529.1 MAG: hypothetical protein A2954_00820 [Candidatus Roizmanbacteria bacterium RIFCSPLOWO2_01_FULL_37_12]